MQDGTILSSYCYKRINASPSEASSLLAFGSSSMCDVSHDYVFTDCHELWKQRTVLGTKVDTYA